MSKKKFTIPTLADIKETNKIRSKSDPALFKSGSKASSVEAESTQLAFKPSVAGTQLHHDPDITVKKPRDHYQSGATKHSPSSDSVRNSAEKRLSYESILMSKGSSTFSKEGTTDESNDVRHSGQGCVAASAVLSAPSSASTSGSSSYRPHAIVVNVVQKKNPLMKHIRNVPWEVGNIIPDFELGKTTGALFLSVRYHSLHPNYIHDRLKSLGKQYQLRVLLVLVDTSESQKVLQELAKIAMLADLTLILSWSYEEAARYLETYKAYENKPPDMIMERIDSDSTSRAIECLTTVKKVNKTDAATLMNTFKTMEKLITSSKEELTLCPGLGPLKAQRLHDLFHEPFLKSAVKKS